MNKNFKYILIFAAILAAFAIVFFLATDERDWIFKDAGIEVAYVNRFVPAVTVTNVRMSEIERTGQSLVSGDTLDTNPNGFALIQFLDESVTRVSPSSRLIVKSNVDQERKINLRTSIELLMGGFMMDVVRNEETQFQIVTNNTVASIKGTRFGVTADSYIWVEEGEVEVRSKATGEVVTLVDRMFVEVDETGHFERGELSVEELTALSDEYRILDADLIEQQLRFQFRDEQGDTTEEDVSVFEQEGDEQED